MHQAHEDNVDLRVMLTEVMVSFRDATARPDLQIRFEDDKDVPAMVRCDPSMLRQVISNLLANAIEHSSGKLVSVGSKSLYILKSPRHVPIRVILTPLSKTPRRIRIQHDDRNILQR